MKTAKVSRKPEDYERVKLKWSLGINKRTKEIEDAWKTQRPHPNRIDYMHRDRNMLRVKIILWAAVHGEVD